MSEERKECIYKKDFGDYRIEARRYKIIDSESYTPTSFALFYKEDTFITALFENQVKIFADAYEDVQHVLNKKDSAL